MKHPVGIFEEPGGLWEPFLRDYFSDAPAAVTCVEDPARAAAFFDKALPSVLFTTPGFLNRPFLQKLRVRRNTDPSFRVFLLGRDPSLGKEPVFDAVFPGAPGTGDFDKHFVEALPAPDLVRLLVVDDEDEIGVMVRDYFGGRRAPAFEIEWVRNGKEALAAVARQRPDVIILDIKMPVMDGREFYTRLKAKKLEIPVIVFFDSVSGEELSEMRKSGNPAVIEKGYQGSSLSALLALVKKLVYFST